MAGMKKRGSRACDVKGMVSGEETSESEQSKGVTRQEAKEVDG